jgi:hypothetical protein
VGDAIASSVTAIYCALMLATSLGLLFTINEPSASGCGCARSLRGF